MRRCTASAPISVSLALLCLVTGLVTAACQPGQAPTPNSEATSSEATNPEATNSEATTRAAVPAELSQRAAHVISRWEAAVAGRPRPLFVPLAGATTQLIGAWEPAVSGNNQAALDAGRLTIATALPVSAPAIAQVRWSDGQVASLRSANAMEAIDQVRAHGSGGCAGCAPLVVTGARLITLTVATSRGPAVAPGWEFRLRGSQARLARVAVSAADVVEMAPLPALEPPMAVMVDRATLDPDGHRLVLSLTGAAFTGDRPCGADYAASVIESSTAVAVIVIAYRNPADVACPGPGMHRSAATTLSSPLGDRTVLEVGQGLPVALTPR